MRSIWKTAMTIVALSAASWNVQAQTVSVIDMAKRSVSVPATVNRIVALGPGALRLMTYLQATDRVVGVEDLEKGSPAGRPYALAHPELARPDLTEGCQKLGSTTASVIDKLGFIERNEEKVERDLAALAKNSAADMGGDTIVPTGPARGGKQTFNVYKCLK